MKCGVVERERDRYGRFKPGRRNYASLLETEVVRFFAETYAPSTRTGALHALRWFLEYNNITVEELLKLSDQEIKVLVKRSVLAKNQEGKYTQARKIFHVLQRFLELNGREIRFTRIERKALFKRIPKRVVREYIPTREDIYRMVDSVPRKNERQWLRAKAIILCLWQSGVRVSCLCSWTWGMFKDKLYPEPRIPVPIKVVAHRPQGVWNCAEDTKLAAYEVGYYYTFLHREASYALKKYLDARIEDGWVPKDKDPIWVTEGQGKMNRERPLRQTNIWEIVKNAAKQIGIDPKTIWPHSLRKAFRKTLYQSGVDLDVAEAMMGHKLPASRGNYFDYHDLSFLKEQYMKGFWERIQIDKIRKLEGELSELRKELEEAKLKQVKYKKEEEFLEKFIKSLKKLKQTKPQRAKEIAKEIKKFLE